MSLISRSKPTGSTGSTAPKQNKQAAIFKIALPEISEIPRKPTLDQPAAQPPDQPDSQPACQTASASPSTEETIRQATRSASTGDLARQGIGKVRLLSESKLEELILQMVDAGIREHLREGARHLPYAQGTAPPLDLKQQLRAEYEKKWQEFQQGQETKLSKLDEKVEGVTQTFTAIEQTLKNLNGEL